MPRKAPTKTRETTTKQQRVYSALRERIRTGAYEPGHRIVIDQLAAEFGVSPLPVREAVRRMQAEGLVVSRPNSSACVAPADPELVEPIIELLAVVEGYVTALAAENLGSTDIERLRELTAGTEHAAAHDREALAQLQSQFHELLEARCPNLELIRLRRDLARRLDVAGRAHPDTNAASDAEAASGRRLLLKQLVERQPSADIERAARLGTARRELARLDSHTRTRCLQSLTTPAHDTR